MTDDLGIIGAGLDAGDLVKQALFNAGCSHGRRIGEIRRQGKGNAVAATVYNMALIDGGIFGVALSGGMPMLYQPDITRNVGQGAGDFFGADAAHGAVDGEF